MTTIADRRAGVALWIVATIAVMWFLRAASQLFIPIAIGALISFALEPVVAWLARRGVPRAAGTVAVLLVLLGLTAWGIYSLRDDVQQATQALPEAARRARNLFTVTSSSGAAGDLQQAAQELGGSTGADGAALAPSAGLLTAAAGSALALAGNIVVVFFLVMFLLLSGGHFRNRIIEAAGPSLEHRTTAARIIDDIAGQIQRFLLVTVVTSVVVAVSTWAVLAWLGVQQPAVWGILAGVFNSIPYFGPVIVCGGLFVVSLVQGGDAAQATRVAGAALVVTSLEGWLLTPALMGKAERMNSVVVFVGLLLWMWIWGEWGAVLGVPMLVVMKAIADHVERFHTLSRLMSP